MPIRQMHKSLIIFSLIACLPIAANSQQSRFKRIFKASTSVPVNNDLDPGLIESEMIEGTADQLQSSQPNQQNQQRQTTQQPNQPKNEYFHQPVVTGKPIQLQSPTTSTRNQSKINPANANVDQFNAAPIPPRNNSLTGQQAPHGKQTTDSQQSFVKNDRPKLTASVSLPLNKSEMIETRRAPTIQTQIVAPKTINVNEIAKVYIQAQNIGQVDVDSIKLTATLPNHAKFVDSIPLPSNVSGQNYEFVLNALQARGKQVIQVEIVPNAKLPLDISTQLQIQSEHKVAVIVQQPVLDVAIEGPKAVHSGQSFKQTITVTNIGDGIAKDVRIKPFLPQNLESIAEKQKTLVPKLLPGQSTTFEIASFARIAGDANVVYQVSAAGAKTREGQTALRVIRPELGVQILGPSQNYLGRDGVYSIQLDNSSDIGINNVDVILQVPVGLQINTISQQAKINRNAGTLSWNFKNIPGKQQQIIQFRAKAIAEGNQICNVAVDAKETGAKQMSLTTEIRGRADLSIQLFDSGAPVGIGSKTEFSIEIANLGSSSAKQVSIRVELPGALMPVNQAGYSIDPSGNYITFDNINIEPGGKETFKFKVVAVSEGEHIVRGIVSVQGSMQSISSENSIFVFESQNAKVSEALAPEVHR